MMELQTTNIYDDLARARDSLAQVNRSIATTQKELDDLITLRNNLGNHVNQILRQMSSEPEAQRPATRREWNRDAEFPRTDKAIDAGSGRPWREWRD